MTGRTIIPIEDLDKPILNDVALQRAMISAMIFAGSYMALWSPTWKGLTINHLSDARKRDSAKFELVCKYFRQIQQWHDSCNRSRMAVPSVKGAHEAQVQVEAVY